MQHSLAASSESRRKAENEDSEESGQYVPLNSTPGKEQLKLY